MESFRRNLSENIFSKIVIFFYSVFIVIAQRGTAESFRIESFRITLFYKTGIFQNGIFQKGILGNGIFQKESFRKYFQQNRNLSEWNLSEGIF
jgi:hypothetical protein